MLIVKKIGSTLIADNEGILRMAKECAETYQKGNDMVIVVSAMGKYMDTLLDMAHEITPNPSARELDMLLAAGAQMSAALLSMALETMEIPAVSLNAQQVKIHTTDRHGDAHITQIETDRIQAELAARKIVIVTGSQGVDEKNDLTTLGKNGTEATAIALAAVLDADACEIDTDTISCANTLRMIPGGAEVLYSRCAELAQKQNIFLTARSGRNRRENAAEKALAGQI